MVSLVQKLKDDPDHVMNILFKENRCSIDTILPPNESDLTFAFPTTMKTRIDLQTIQKHFRFHNAPTDNRTGLVSSMINSFFGRKVFYQVARKQKNGKRVYTYTTDVDFGMAWRAAVSYTIPIQREKKEKAYMSALQEDGDLAAVENLALLGDDSDDEAVIENMDLLGDDSDDESEPAKRQRV
jgi:hypothetical protein